MSETALLLEDQQVHVLPWMATTQPIAKTPTLRIYWASEKTPDISLRLMDRHEAGTRLVTVVRKPRKIMTKHM